MLYAVIMAGGSGTRFWPKSRQRTPKQLVQIVGDGTMIQQTVARVEAGLPRASILVLTNATQVDAMREQLPQLSPGQVLAEPCGRDTAACIGLAAMIVRQSDPEGVMAVLSADHVISPANEWARCIEAAASVACKHGVLVAFGIPPSGPSELYGYIRRGMTIPCDNGAPPAFRIAEFKEKPSHSQAEKFLLSGDYYWNSGNFVWRSCDILASIQSHAPDLDAGFIKIAPALGTPDQDAAIAEHYPELPRTSIDYAVMERAGNTAVVEATFAWDDVGTWDAVARHYPADENRNVILANNAAIGTSDCIIAGPDDHLIATVGVKNLIIVHTPDATLVCGKECAGQVKALVELLRARNSETHL